MSITLKILILEDNPLDAQLEIETLSRAGYDCQWDLVEKRDEYIEKLKSKVYDLIIVDYSLPSFDGFSAIKIYMELGLKIPLIVISGTIGEEKVVECLRAGATDYVLKDKLDRLIPVVKRALREFKERRQLEMAQIALRESEARYRRISDSIKEVVFCYDIINEKMEFVSLGVEKLIGFSDEVVYQDPKIVFDLVSADDISWVKAIWMKSFKMTVSSTFECQITRKSGHKRWLHINTVSVGSGKQITAIEGSVRDITAQKQAEEQLKESRDQLRRLTLHLQSIREEERSLMARKVHDELGQLMTMIKIDLKWVEQNLPGIDDVMSRKMETMSDTIDETARKVQKISSELHPSLLDDLGLKAAIEWQVDEFSKRMGIKCEAALSDNIDCDEKLSTALFRICQEALTNAARHAESGYVKVSLAQKGDNIVMSISDDGKGIPADKIDGSGSLGILGMRERLYPWNGSVEIDAPAAGGTRVVVTVPVQSA